MHCEFNILLSLFILKTILIHCPQTALHFPVISITKLKSTVSSNLSVNQKEILYLTSNGLKMENLGKRNPGRGVIMEIIVLKQPTNMEQTFTNFMLMSCVSFNFWNYKM